MAYGQTGAGKTYSLSSIAADAIGMIPRAAAEVFSHVEQDQGHEYTVYMSYVQLYMELIQVGTWPGVGALAGFRGGVCLRWWFVCVDVVVVRCCVFRAHSVV